MIKQLDKQIEISEYRETPLQGSRKSYQRIINNALVGIYQAGKYGNVIMANQKMAEMFGYDSPQDFLSSVKNFADLYVRPEERSLILDEISEKGFVKGKEIELLRKTGERFWAKLYTTLFRDGDKIIYEGLMEDISERKQAEGSLHESEEKYRGLVENINEIVYRTDETGKVHYVSPKIETISGYTQSEVLEKGFIEFVHPDDIEGLMETFLEVMSGKSTVSEYRFITKDERTVWIRTNALPIKKGDRVVGVQGVLSDITEHKKFEEALKKNNERLEALIHAMPVGIVIIDPETHKIVDVNPKAVLMIGSPADGIIGLQCHNFICLAEEGKCPITDLGRTIDNAERGLMTADGKIVPVHKTVYPINIDGQELLLECFVDISEFKRAEQEKLKKEKLKSVIETAGAVCHEMNQPLQAISGYAELLMMAFEKDNISYDKINKIKSQVDRMGEIIKKLMRITEYKTMEYLDGRIIDIGKSTD